MNGLDPARWQQVCDAFEALLAVGAGERARTAGEVCGSDAGLRSEVESLLERCGRAPGFLSECAALTAGRRLAEDEAAQRLGPWKLRGMIGRGGMAVVYRAERDDGHFRKTAAAKILRVGVFGEEVLLRFQRERQILADLDHPNIVKLLDGGVAPDGRPYLVMDLVEGVSLTEYCNGNGLDLNARIGLFLKVCETVAYAHSHHVVHRDLKPGNILVTEAGEPRLLDFGIAKLVDAESAEGETAATRFPFLTPGYASPEQARGLTASAASDQYSLAVILCELTAGHAPCDLRGLPLLESLRAVCERPLDLEGVPAALRPVVERALAKDPEKRFESVSAFAAEVGRFAAGELAPSRPWRRRALVGALAGGAAGAAVWLWKPTPRGPKVTAVAKGMMNEGFPSVSSDGEWVSYVEWDSSGATIWLAGRTGGSKRKVVELPGARETLHTRISPDGRTLAFLGLRPDGLFDIRTVDISGGAVRTWTRIDGAALSWAPDSQWVAVCDRPEAGGPVSVFAHWLVGGQKRRLSNPPAGSWGDIDVAVSPDGTHLAVIRYSARGDGDIWLLSWNGQLERRLTSLHTWFNGMAFTPDGKEIVFSPVVTPLSLKRVGIDGGPVRPVPVIQAMHPQIGGPPQAPVMAYASHQAVMRLYRGEIRDGVIENRRLLLPYHQGGESPAYRADGSRIGWVDDKGVWTAKPDGSEARKLVAVEGLKRDLVWSPDGGTVAFTARSGGSVAVWVADSASGKARRLTNDNAAEGRPVWSRDGAWIYWRSERDGTGRYWRRRWPDGPLEMVSPPAVEGMPGGDGRTFYFLDNDQRSPLYEVAAGETGGARQVAGIPPLRSGSWRLDGDAIFYRVVSGDREMRGYRQPLAGQGRQEIFTMTFGGGPPIDLASSPDLREALWSEWETETDVWTAEGFLI